MLARHYYLNASLPSLMCEVAAPLSSDAFLTLCQGHLNEANFDSLRSPESQNSVWKRWHRFDRNLRGAVAVLRAEKLGWTRQGPEPDPSLSMRETATAAFEEKNPLAAELILFKARWWYLEEIGKETFMTLENLIVYLLKLKLLEERFEFLPEDGERALSDLRRTAETESPIV